VLATPGLIMVSATYTMLLPVTARGPLVGPSQGALTSSACATARFAVFRTAGHLLANDAPCVGLELDDEVGEPCEQPPATPVVVTAFVAAARRTRLRVKFTRTSQ
jgi:hypothetical protein